jgi:hypothetical protein
MLAEAIARANLRAGGVLPSTDLPPGAQNGSQGLQGGAETAYQGDPWAGNGQQNQQTTQQTTQTTQQQPNGTTIQGKNGPIQVTFNAGPHCGCGLQSALYTGFSNGKQWRAFRCAKGAGDDWRGKCSFQQWA